MKYSLPMLSYWLLSLCSVTSAFTQVSYTGLVVAYDITGLELGSVTEGSYSYAFFKAPQTGLYTFQYPYPGELSLGYGYDFRQGYAWSTTNPYFGMDTELNIFLLEGFYYPLAGYIVAPLDSVTFCIDDGTDNLIPNYLYSAPVSTYPTSDYNINFVSESYLIAKTTTSGTVSTTITGPYTTQFLDSTTSTTVEAIFPVVPFPVETSYGPFDTVYTTETITGPITATYVVDVIATSASTSSSIISSSSSSGSSIISSVQGSVSSSTSSSVVPLQTYIWTADYTSTITMTVADGYISVPSGGLFKRDVAYETAVLIPTPTSINWAGVSGNTEVVEYVELYENGQTSAIDVTYTRLKSSATSGSFGSSSTSTTTITTRSTVTSTETSVQTVTKYATATGVVTSSSGSIATTRTTTATTSGSGVSSYTDVVTTTNSLGQTVVYTELVVVLPESVSSSTAASSNSTSTGVVTTVNDVGETIVATDIVVYCPESTRSTIGSVSATSSSVVTSVNSTETLVYTEVVVYCPESTRTAAGSVSSTSTGHATTTNAEGATITYTDVVVYCPETGLESVSQTTDSNIISGTSTSKETGMSLQGSIADHSSSSVPSTSLDFEQYQGNANILQSFSFCSVIALFFMIFI